jgi:hypothetical protein
VFSEVIKMQAFLAPLRSKYRWRRSTLPPLHPSTLLKTNWQNNAEDSKHENVGWKNYEKCRLTESLQYDVYYPSFFLLVYYPSYLLSLFIILLIYYPSYLFPSCLLSPYIFLLRIMLTIIILPLLTVLNRAGKIMISAD